MKRGDNKKTRHKKKMIVSADNKNDHPKKAYIYNIEKYGGKAPKIYIRTYYNGLGLKIKYEINSKD